jgi:PKD repeat protein
MKRIILFLFALAGMMVALQAQTTVTVQGQVLCNGRPVPGYSGTLLDSLSGTSLAVMTDSTGTYFATFSTNTTQGMVLAIFPTPGGSSISAVAFYSPPSFSVIMPPIDICGGGGGGCQASFTGGLSAMNPMTWNFTDQSSGSGPGTQVTSWSWDFGDGSTSSLQNPTHTYAASGNYNVCLVIVDGSGCTDSTCQLVIVPTSPTPCRASFSSIDSAGTLYFTGMVTGGTPPYIYSWDFGDGTTSIGSFVTKTYNANGNYQVCLTISDAGGCVDSTCQNVTVGNPGPSCSADFSVMSGQQPGEFIFTNQSQGLPGQATNTYSWGFGDNTVSNQTSPTHTYAASGVYQVCLYMTSSSMGQVCTDTFCLPLGVQIAPVGASIMGSVWLGNSRLPGDSSLVYLIELDSVAGTLTAIDSTGAFISGMGMASYTFSNLNPGSYRTKTALLPGNPNYANYLPTYHDSVLQWNNAQVISLGANTQATADIYLKAGNNPGGPGFIGGLISQGANKQEGDPLENISVLLFDSNDEPVTHALTNANGEYSFSNLAYGTYRIHVEVLNRISTDQFVTISAASSAASNINFAVSSTTVDVTTSLQDLGFGKLLQVFPNPVSEQLQVQVKLDKATELHLAVMDMLGRRYLQQSQQLTAGEQQLKLDFSRLPKGIYMLSLQADGQTVSQKVIKQ